MPCGSDGEVGKSDESAANWMDGGNCGSCLWKKGDGNQDVELQKARDGGV